MSYEINTYVYVLYIYSISGVHAQKSYVYIYVYVYSVSNVCTVCCFAMHAVPVGSDLWCCSNRWLECLHQCVTRGPAVVSYLQLLAIALQNVFLNCWAQVKWSFARSRAVQLQPAPAVLTLTKPLLQDCIHASGPCHETTSWTLMAFDLQSAAEEEARMASMSADARKKYKQKQRKVCPATWHSCLCLPCLFYQCTLHQSHHHCSHACLMPMLGMLFKSQESKL